MADIFEIIEKEQWELRHESELDAVFSENGNAELSLYRISTDHNSALHRIFKTIKSAIPEDVFSFDQLSDWADRNGYTRDEGDYK